MKWLKNTIVWQTALLILLIAAWPLLRPEFFRMHDYTHVARLVEMLAALRAGHFPVHWSANFGWGYGMPLFLFYGPLPFYLASIPALLGLSELVSIKLLIFLAHVLAWWGMYKALSRFGRAPALIGATAFLFAPYRAVDLYVRGALNELFALSLLPWILHFSWQITESTAKEKWRHGCLGVSASTAALVLSHNLTAFIASPFLLVLGLLPLLAEKKKKYLSRFSYLVLGWVGAAVLSAWYAIPAFLEKDLTIVNQITQGYFNYQLHFLYIRQFWQADWGFGGSVFGPDDNISFHLDHLTILLAIFTLAALIWKLYRQFTSTNLKTFKSWLLHQSWRQWWLVLPFVTSGLLALSLWMTTFHSQPLWEKVTLLHFVQFPWRFLAVSNLLLALLAGWSVWFIRPWWRRWVVTWLLLIGIIISALPFHKPAEFLEDNTDFYYTDQDLIRRKMSDILNDYVPQTFNRALPPTEPSKRIAISSLAELPPFEYNLPQEFLIQFKQPVKGTITWNIAHFPGWKYTINHQEVAPHLNEDGLMEYEGHDITSVGAYYSYTTLRSAMIILSGSGLVVWLLVGAPYFLKQIKPVKDKNVKQS